MGAPSTPGGPALRLIYTTGGIGSVVGWDADGSSIFYSAMSKDVGSLPDVRLFILRFSWGDSGNAVESVNGEDGDTGESQGSRETVT